jgi:hypothetical protein
VYLPDLNDSKKRKPIPIEIIRQIQQDCMQADDEARWLVALISDTGMRLSEAAGLHIDDIKLDCEIPYIDLKPHEWRSLKTKGSQRQIPLVGASLWAAQRIKETPFLFPLWFNGPIYLVINSIALLVFFTAPILTAINWGFGWTLVTIFELIFGIFIAGVLPLNYRVFLTLTGPFLILAFAGALLNLWYLNNIAILVLLVLGFGLPFLLLNNQNNGNAGAANSTQPMNSTVSNNTSQSNVQNTPKQTNKQNVLPTFLIDLDIAKLPKKGKKASLMFKPPAPVPRPVIPRHFAPALKAVITLLYAAACDTDS